MKTNYEASWIATICYKAGVQTNSLLEKAHFFLNVQ